MGSREWSGYTEGQAIRVDVGSLIFPEWTRGKVAGLSPETDRLLLKLFERVFRLRPMDVEIDESSPVWPCTKVRIYKGGDRVRPLWTS